MFKRLFCALFATVLVALGTINHSASAVSGENIIDNLYDLCQSMLIHGYSLDGSGTCDAYSRTQTSATNLEKRIYIWDNIVLKNLDLSFTYSYSPFIIYNGGSLTIDGGHYSSPSCVVWIQYDNSINPGVYEPSTSITINSGVFEASLSSQESIDSPSPVCLISMNRLTTEEAENAIANYLPAGRRFINLGTRSANSDIPVSEGGAHISKSYEIIDSIEYLQTTAVAVIEDEGLGGETEPEVKPTEVGEESEQEETEDDIAKPEEAVVPKAPNSGVNTTTERTSKSSIAIAVIFTVVIFTTIIWGYNRRNR